MNKIQMNCSNDKIETHQSCGILLKLFAEYLKKITPKNERFPYVELNNIRKRIIKLQKDSNYTIYQFYGNERKKISNVFLNDLQLLISQKNIYIKTSTQNITITTLGLLNASNIILPKLLKEYLNSFTD